MGVIQRLRQVEEAGKKAAHLGADLVRTGMHNAEDSVRRQVISHRSHAKSKISPSVHPDPEQESPTEPNARTGIVSINGQDVEEMRCTGGRRSA